MNRSRKFNKKEAVRFLLVPGRDEHGNPTTTFKPVETRNRLSRKEREKIIGQFSDYQIEIDGKQVDESEIPSYVLEQIRGRADLIFNQKNPLPAGQQEEEDYMEEEMEQNESEEEAGEEIPEEQYMGYGADSDNPKLEQAEQKIVDLDGHKYKLTAAQQKLLGQVLPDNYEDYRISGVEFTKYDEDGNKIEQRESYQKYIADPLQRKGIIDSYIYVPDKPLSTVDNDLDGQTLKGDLKEIEDALNYQGPEQIYQEMEDDFFSQLIASQPKKQDPQDSLNEKGFQKSKKPSSKSPATAKDKINNSSLKAEIEGKDVKHDESLDDAEQDSGDYQDEEQDEEITDQMLDKALQEFEGQRQMPGAGQLIAGTGIPVGVKGMQLVRYIEEREGCTGRDGELDWRTLTRKQKKEYMKNKQIREVYDQVRERQIKQKLKGKRNINADQLHLKKYIDHIPYDQDHVMQEAIQRDEQKMTTLYDEQEEQQFQTESDEDDIISHRAKTSIISSNLTIVEEAQKIKQKKQKTKQQGQIIKNIEKIKAIPDVRNRNQTQAQRKQRKNKLKELKKMQKEQKRQFNQVFELEKKKTIKREKNANSNPFHKVSHVKII